MIKLLRCFPEVNCRSSLLLASVFGLLLAVPAQLRAQTRSMPSPTYFVYFDALHSGNYREALKGFEDEIGGALKTVQSRWIDSICYYTMAGECYYKMGNYSKALANYNAALNVYVAYPNWLLQVRFPDSIGSVANIKPIPWSNSKRVTKIGSFPDTMLVMMGKVDNEDVLRKGGTLQPAHYLKVNVQEVVRCTALAIRRRRELLGPAIHHDRLTDQLVTVLSRKTLAPPNHWSQGWIDLQLGMALAAAGKTGQALGRLQSSLQVAGEFDHPATGMTLCELGRLALESGDLTTAATMFEEATYSSAMLGDYTSLEESIRFGQTVHLMSNSKGVYPLLDKVALWARNRAGEVYASALTLGAENYAVLGDLPRATTLAGESRARMGRSDMSQREIGARLNYVDALLSYSRGNVNDGDKALASVMQYYASASKWLFQIDLVDKLFVSQAADVTAREATELYEILLREPTATDWGINPLESLAVVVTPTPGPYERWFEAALKRTGELDEVLEIADRAKRHRFYTSQPMGGRILSLRWILEGPEENLDQAAMLQRQDLLARYPNYATLADEARKIRTELLKQPLVPSTPEATRAQSTDLAKLSEISQAQEAIIRSIAVRREAAEAVFPPMRKTKDVQAALPPGHLLLVFFSTSRNTYAFLYNNKQHARWEIASPAELQKRTMSLLKSLGQVDPNREVTYAQLTDEAWRKEAQEVTRLLFEKSKVNLAEGCEELIVVPDGALWYLPFELLQIKDGSETTSLLNRSRVRYVPTMGLALPLRHGRKEAMNLAVATGKLYPRDQVDTSTVAFQRLKESLATATALPATLPAPSPIFKTLLDGLIVLDDLNGTESPYNWSPIQLDKTKAAGALSNWISLPWGGPDYLILPGYHTAAETGLRRGANNGNEVFLSVCGLMATGTRTALISRWRTGGQTSYDLIREFVQELPYSSAADAWQRSVELVKESPIDPHSEPRVKPGTNAEIPTSGNPFFWAGYMLIDSGILPQKPAVEPETTPKLDFEKQAMGQGEDSQPAALPADAKKEAGTGDAISEPMEANDAAESSEPAASAAEPSAPKKAGRVTKAAESKRASRKSKN